MGLGLEVFWSVSELIDQTVSGTREQVTERGSPLTIPHPPVVKISVIIIFFGAFPDLLSGVPAVSLCTGSRKTTIFA